MTSPSPDIRQTKYALGIDMGGTNSRVGLFSQEGLLCASHSFSTSFLVGNESDSAIRDSFESILSAARVSASDVAAIGLALAAVFDGEGKLQIAPNLDVDLGNYQSILRDFFNDTPIHIINDSNAAVLGDRWQGTAADLSLNTFMLVTLGTGLGGGVVLNGELYEGAHGAAGEIGHLCLEPHEGRPCKCGKTGCLERYVSSSGISLTAQELFTAESAKNNISSNTAGLKQYAHAKMVFDAAEQGDMIAKRAVSSFSGYLAQGLSCVATVLDPDAFILGGGLARSSDVFIDELRKKYRHYAFSVCKDIPLLISSIASDCGLYGAAYHALQSEHLIAK